MHHGHALGKALAQVYGIEPGTADHAQAGLISVTSASGASPASIAASVDAFRTFTGGGAVAGPNGSFGGVRREINWDAVPDTFASSTSLPPNFFNTNSPRGAVLATPGAGFRVSADSSNPTGTPVRFGDLNPAYVTEFQAFSPERLFGVPGGTVMDVLFFVPGTNTPAAVTAFGAVFVDNPRSAFPSCGSIQAFNGVAFKIHNLTPEEVTILKGGEVTFQIHGGGHAMAIYEVSKDTTRDEIGQYLCPGNDPSTTTDPTLHACGPAAPVPINVANANAEHVVLDGHGDVVIVAAPNVTNAHPDNRVWSIPGRLMSAGGHQFLSGGNVPAGPTSNGQLITYQFLKTGRYLVVCINRSHLLNDWMFGFVNVTGQ